MALKRAMYRHPYIDGRGRMENMLCMKFVVEPRGKRVEMLGRRSERKETKREY